MNFSIFSLLGDNYFYFRHSENFFEIIAQIYIPRWHAQYFKGIHVGQRHDSKLLEEKYIPSPFVTKLFTWKIFTRSAISLDRVFGNWQFHVRSHFICIYTRNVGRVPHPSPYYWSLPAEIIMLRNNERHMVTLRLLTRIIIAGIDYMPFRAVNSVNHERIYDTIRDREHIEAGNASSKMQQVRPRIRLDKRIVKILILAIPFFFKHYCV